MTAIIDVTTERGKIPGWSDWPTWMLPAPRNVSPTRKRGIFSRERNCVAGTNNDEKKEERK